MPIWKALCRAAWLMILVAALYGLIVVGMFGVVWALENWHGMIVGGTIVSGVWVFLALMIKMEAERAEEDDDAE